MASELDFAKHSPLIRDALMTHRNALSMISFLQYAGVWVIRKTIDAFYVANAIPYFYQFKVN